MWTIKYLYIKRIWYENALRSQLELLYSRWSRFILTIRDGSPVANPISILVHTQTLQGPAIVRRWEGERWSKAEESEYVSSTLKPARRVYVFVFLYRDIPRARENFWNCWFQNWGCLESSPISVSLTFSSIHHTHVESTVTTLHAWKFVR